jgi:hypothetical protein
MAYSGQRTAVQPCKTPLVFSAQAALTPGALVSPTANVPSPPQASSHTTRSVRLLAGPATRQPGVGEVGPQTQHARSGHGFGFGHRFFLRFRLAAPRSPPRSASSAPAPAASEARARRLRVFGWSMADPTSLTMCRRGMGGSRFLGLAGANVFEIMKQHESRHIVEMADASVKNRGRSRSPGP